MKKTVVWLLLLSLMIGTFASALPILADEASSMPKAPISLDYQIESLGSGLADGMVTVTLPAGHGAEDIYLFWGDDNGKLPGYTSHAPFKVSGNIVTHRIVSGSVIPEGATRLLAYSYSDANGMSQECASCTLPAGAAITPAQLGTLLFEFQTVSDLHITATYEPRIHHSEHMKAMLEDIMAVSPNSIGILNTGDTVNNGYDSDYEEFMDILSRYENAPPIYSSFGNHELFRYGTDSKFPTGQDEFTEMKDIYWQFLGQSVPEDAVFSSGTRFGSLSFSFVKNNCKFIFLGTDVMNQNNLTLDAATLAWLESELEAATGKGNPIFIVMHQPMSGTIAGTFKNNYGVTEYTTKTLKNLLVKYPEVIMFNGHTHRDLNQYATYYLRDEMLPNIFGASSAGYLARAYDSASTETYKGSEGYYIYVYEDKVFIRGRNFLTGEWMPSTQVVIDLSEEALKTPHEAEIEPPLYGGTAKLMLENNKLSGTVQCNMPVSNNADVIALFFSSVDTGIIGSDPFATLEVNSKDTYFTCEIPFADVQMPYTADYILVYSYSYELGWSADCDIIDLKANVKGGGAPSSGNLTMNKYSFIEGEQILVTAYKNISTSWVGIRKIDSSDYRTWNYWLVSDAGIGKAVDISKDSWLLKRDYTALTPGVYEIAWLEKSNDGGFLATKTPENTTVFVVQAKDNASSSGVVKTNKSVYRLGEPIYVTATKGEDKDWIGMQLTTETSGTKIWYNLSVSGVGEAFDISKQASYTGVSGTDYKFNKLEAGKYQLAWLPSSKTNFQTGKAAADTVTITVVDMSEMMALGVPVGDGISDPNTSVLDAALAEAENLKEANYTAESWQVLLDAVAAAELVVSNSDHTQEEIDAAYEAIVRAVGALVPAPAKPNNTTVTPPATEETPEQPSGEPATTAPEEEKSGCGSSIGAASAFMLLALLPVVLKKKEEA